MRYPALTRMLGVFLAVLSVVTIIAGALGFGRDKKDYQEDCREDALLESRIAQTDELRGQLNGLQEGYDEASGLYPDSLDSHESRRSAYRMNLATYTATKAGLQLGRAQLDATKAMLDESMTLFQAGLDLFRESEAAFQEIYDAYLVMRETLDRANEIYDEAAARVPEGEDGEVTFSPEEVLALAELGHSGNEQMSALLTELRDGIAPDQHEAGEFLRRAIAQYNEADSSLDSFSVELLAYEVSLALYDRAQEALDGGIAEGLSEEEARAAADRICEESFGLSFDEVGQWLEENKPTSAEEGGESGGIPPEMLNSLLDEMPSDRDLVDIAIGLLADSDRELTEKEEAFRNDPHDMSAAELVLAASKEDIDSSERLLEVVEPTVLETKQQMDAAHEQLDSAWYAIYSGQQQVEEGYRDLVKKAAEQLAELHKMRRERHALELERQKLDELEDTMDGYRSVDERYRALRAQLLADDDVYERYEKGEDFLAAARAVLEERTPLHRSVYESRLVVCALMLAGGLFGLLAALGAFEKPKIRHLWLPLTAAILFSAAAEALSLQLGRGLAYSGLFVGIFAVLLLPLCVRTKKGNAP